jgi:hypothetical protein
MLPAAAFATSLIRLEAIDLRVRFRNDWEIPVVHKQPRRELRVLQRAQRFIQAVSREMEAWNFAASDVAVPQRPFHRAQSHESGSKCFECLGVFGAGNLALCPELLDVHFVTFRGWLIPRARSSGAGSGVFAGGTGCFTFAAALNVRPGCIALLISFAAVSAVRGLDMGIPFGLS